MELMKGPRLVTGLALTRVLAMGWSKARKTEPMKATLMDLLMALCLTYLALRRACRWVTSLAPKTVHSMEVMKARHLGDRLGPDEGSSDGLVEGMVDGSKDGIVDGLVNGFTFDLLVPAEGSLLGDKLGSDNNSLDGSNEGSLLVQQMRTLGFFLL